MGQAKKIYRWEIDLMEKYNKDITAVIPVREGSTRLKNKM
mgnify:CR=1 FL=1